MSVQPDIDVSLNSDAEYAKLTAKRDEIVAEKGDVEKQIKALRHQIANSKTPISALKRGVRVAEILGDPAPPVAIDISKIAPLRQRLADLEFAFAEINRRIDTARYRASAGICENLKRPYAAVVQELGKALIDCHRANADYRRFVDRLTDADVAWIAHLEPLHPRNVRLDGDLTRTNTVAVWLKEAVRAGYIDASTVPEELGGPAKATGIFSKGKAVKK